jgi:hypothetical protein
LQLHLLSNAPLTSNLELAGQSSMPDLPSRIAVLPAGSALLMRKQRAAQAASSVRTAPEPLQRIAPLRALWKHFRASFTLRVIAK